MSALACAMSCALCGAGVFLIDSTASDKSSVLFWVASNGFADLLGVVLAAMTPPFTSVQAENRSCGLDEPGSRVPLDAHPVDFGARSLRLRCFNEDVDAPARG